MYVAAVLLQGIADHVRACGFTTDQLLLGTGIEPTALRDPSARLPLDCVDRYVTRAMELTQDPGLGLTLAMNPPAGALTIIYHLVLASRTLRDAFITFQGIAGQLIERSEWALLEEGGTARCMYGSPIALGSTSRFAVDMIFAFIFKLTQQFFRGRVARPVRVSFRHARPLYAARYDAVFGCSIEFEAAQNSLCFEAELLDDSQLLGNERLKESLEASARKMLSAHRDEPRVSEQLRVLLRCTGDLRHVCSESMARRMALSPRSLRRKLQLEGISLTEVVDHVRREIACEAMVRPDICIQTTAERLGFAERTAFHRAFKRWTGETPQLYRKRRMSTLQP